jgi:GTPase SAR1 family protein
MYRSLVPMFSRGANIGVIVFDVTRHDTFDSVDDWTALFADLPSGQCRLVVVGNKSDLQPWGVSADEVAAYCAPQHLPHFITSALTGDGIEELFEGLTRIAVARAESQSLLERSALANRPQEKEGKKGLGCCADS